MEVERKKIKRDKLKAAFKVSKTKVRLWEEKFQAEQGRKPTKEERKQAPENVVVAWKNICKIQAFFEQEDKDNKLAKLNDGGEHVDDCDPPVGLSLEDVKENLTEGGLLTAPVVGSEISSKGDGNNPTGGACKDISNVSPSSFDSHTTPLSATAPAGLGVWGAHLNMKPAAVKIAAPSNFEKLSTKLALQATTSSTRKSLKKKGKKSTSFFDTLGDSQNSMDLASPPSSLIARSLSTPLSSSHSDENAPMPINRNTSSTECPPEAEKRINVVAAEDSNSGGDIFPGLSLAARAAPAVPSKPTPSMTLSRTVDSAWLARCGAPAPEEALPSRTNFKGLIPTAPSSSLPDLGGSWVGVGWGANLQEPKYQVPEKFDPEEREKNWAGSKLDTKVEESDSLVKSEICSEEPQVAKGIEPVVKEEYAVVETLPQEEMLPPLQPAYKLNKVKQKMTLEDLEAAAEEEVDDDPDYEVEQESMKKAERRGGKGKRKRSSSSDSEGCEEAAIFYPECSMELGLEETKPKPKKKNGGTGKKKAKPARARKKKRGLSEGEEEGIGSKDGGDGEGLEIVREEGPLDINLFALGFEETEVKDIVVKKSMTQGERLTMKVTTGKASDNFLKIDLKKKSFAKGKNSGAKMKRFEYKRKVALKEGTKVKESKCYRCGEVGHWATQCTGGQGDRLIPEQMAEEFDPGDFPTLDQARQMASGVLPASSATSKLFVPRSKQTSDQQEVPPLCDPVLAEDSAQNGAGHCQTEQRDHSDMGGRNETAIEQLETSTTPCLDFEAADDADLLEACRQFDCAQPESAAARYAVPPLHSSEEEVQEALGRWGYPDFRPGQLEAVMRILAGKSTLVLLATGTGKSLIYQLPALLYRNSKPCITLVVSPLVSLMEDQVTGLPPFLKAAALHYNMTSAQKDRVADQVKSGRLHFLLVSPEAVAGGGGAFGALLPHLPPIAFVCIDEAHCVSHWSHNFRPSYLRLAKIIREKLGVATILGLTATAPESITRSVSHHLGVPADGVIRGPLLPGNLLLTVSRDPVRDRALIQMLGEGSLSVCESVIVYCTRRDECERLATLIRTQLQARDLKQGKAEQSARGRVSVTAEPYHAGMTAHRRKTVQTAFMTGKLRVVVATVAFGMGIDKADIRAIVHYNMPKAFESYIQEIGRAGRDGLPARGHLFLDSRPGGDTSELKRHIFSNSVDRHTLAKLLRAVFPPGRKGPKGKLGEVALSVVELVEHLDMPEENISTLLCYLENRDSNKPPLLRLENPVYSKAKVQCYGGPRQLRAVAARCPPLAAAIALLRQDGVDINLASSVEFGVVNVAATMDWSSAVVKKELKNLEWSSSGSGWKKTGVLVEFSDLAFHFFSDVGLTEEEQDELLDWLHKQVEARERAELSGLSRLAKAFSAVSYSRQEEAGEEDEMRSAKLKGFVKEYFTEEERREGEAEERVETCEHEQQVRGAIRAFVTQNQEHTWSGRAVARVFHGIQSPNFPAKQWGRVRSAWRSHLDVDFNLLVRMATQEVLSLRTGR